MFFALFISFMAFQADKPDGRLDFNDASNIKFLPYSTDYIEFINQSLIFTKFRCAIGMGLLPQKSWEDIEAQVPYVNDIDRISINRFKNIELLLKDKIDSVNYKNLASFSSQELSTEFKKNMYLQEVIPLNYQISTLRAYLKSFREPELSVSNIETYRLLIWQKTELPISVRVTKTPTGATLIAKMLGNSKEVEPSQLCLRIEKFLTPKEFEDIHSCFVQPNIWDFHDDDFNPGWNIVQNGY